MENFGEKNKLTPEQIKEQTEKILETGEVISETGLEGGKMGSNISYYVEFKDGRKGLYKPKNGEDEDIYQIFKIEQGSLFKRERAAYLINRALNFNLVPPTVIREIGDKGVGSVQEFIPDSDTYWRLNFDKQDKVLSASRDQLINLWLFDYIIFNADRRKRNLLVQDTIIYAIDNGLAFNNFNFAPFDHFFNKQIPQGAIDAITKFIASEQEQNRLRDLLSELLPMEEIDACINRIEFIGKLLEKEQAISDETRLIFNPKN